MEQSRVGELSFCPLGAILSCFWYRSVKKYPLGMGNLATCVAEWAQVLREPAVFWLQAWVERWEGDGPCSWGSVGSRRQRRLLPPAVSCLHQRRFVFQRSLPGRGELHADGQPGAEEAGLPLPDELRQEPAGHGHHGSQHLREGERRGLACPRAARCSGSVQPTACIPAFVRGRRTQLLRTPLQRKGAPAGFQSLFLQEQRLP